MTTIETAERKSKWRALAFYLFAAVILAILCFSMGPAGGAIDGDDRDLFRGLWFGVVVGAAVNLLPLGRWLKPHSIVARLLDDEGTREHRRMACVCGFWAAIAASLAVAMVVHDGPVLNPFDVARVVATAAMVAALVSFATLELRAQAPSGR